MNKKIFCINEFLKKLFNFLFEIIFSISFDKFLCVDKRGFFKKKLGKFLIKSFSVFSCVMLFILFFPKLAKERRILIYLQKFS